MEYIVFGFVALGLLLIFISKAFYDDRKEQKRFILHLKNDYGNITQKEYRPEQYASISRYFEKHACNGQIDEITWNDLSMDDVYRSMNDTYSSAGEEVLYYTLRTPKFNEDELSKMEDQITYVEKHTEERINLQLLFHKLGYTGRFSLYDYIENLNLLGEKNNKKHLIVNALYIPSIILCFFKPSYGIIATIGIMLYSIFSYFKEKNEIDPYITSFAYVMRLLCTVQKMENMSLPSMEEELHTLCECKKKLGKFVRGSFWLMTSGRMSGSGNILDIFLDYCRMVFHLDLIKFNTMLKQVKEHRQEVDTIFYTLGYIETIIAITSYRKSTEKVYCVPLLKKDCKLGIETSNMYHPLIMNPVKNSISVKRGVLLTGSNASGKSTFLKTVALNAIFAQTIHTVLADSYQGFYTQVCSSMSLRDDINSHESYYMVEIKAIKRILDLTENHDNVLCFVDEVLRGTNTVERISASTEILKSLCKPNVICFAATHDVELTDLLNEQYDNYHFEEEIIDGDVFFNYSLMKGKATTRNAIKLLGIMGYESNIIDHANQRAEVFLKTGIWK